MRESVLSLCGSCLCFFFNFRCSVSAIHLSSLCQQSLSSLFWHNTTGKRLYCLIQYYTLVYLKYFMTVQNKKPLCALLIFSSETILIITRRKMNVLCPTLRYYAHLPDTCNYVKNQEVLRAIERKVLHQKLPPWSFNFSGSSLFLLLASRSRRNNLCVFPLSLLNEKTLAT